MKLRPLQIFGLVAVLVFGSYLVVQLAQGPRDPDVLPSGVRISDLPTISAPPADTAPIPAEPLAVGSQDAKDDLYCSGIVFGELLKAPNVPDDEAQRRRDAYAALAEHGRARLETEGAAKGAGAFAVGNAWADKARSDYKADAARIPFADCMTRAAGLKPVNDPLTVGSETARDDLYCSGVIFAVHRSKPEDALSDDAQKRRDAVIALAEAGVAKLKTDGVATDATTASFADAHSEKAAKDFAAGKTRISFEECMGRAAIPGAPN
jgi:hypothetical protein